MDINDKKLLVTKNIYIGNDGVGRCALPTLMIKVLGIQSPGSHSVKVTCDLKKKEIIIKNGVIKATG